MFRSILFACALVGAGSAAAQEVAISGKDFLSGAGDAKIAELARQAAASGKTLVITAPPYWQDKAAAKAHAGAANASVRASDAFFENVMVRIEDSKSSARQAEASAPKAAPAPKAEVRPEPKPGPPAPKPVVTAPPAPAAAPTPVAAPPPAAVPPPPAPREVAPEPAPEPAPVAAPPPAPAPVVAAPPAAPPPAAKPAAPAPDPSVAIKQRLVQNLNGGQAAEGTLQVSQLQKDDLLFVDGPVRAVVRRFGPRNQLYWLEGDLNLERVELLPTGNDRYRVTEAIHNVSNPTLRSAAKGNALKLVANVPAPKSPARTAIEKQYNDGRDIATTLAPGELRQGDYIYTGEGSAVVVRRRADGIERYWLVGELDLRQTGLQTQGNAIRVLTDTIK